MRYKKNILTVWVVRHWDRLPVDMVEPPFPGGVQELSESGWCFSGVGITVVGLGWWLDLVVLKVSFTFDDSLILGPEAFPRERISGGPNDLVLYTMCWTVSPASTSITKQKKMTKWLFLFRNSFSSVSLLLFKLTPPQFLSYKWLNFIIEKKHQQKQV